MQELRFVLPRSVAEAFLVDVARFMSFCVHDVKRPVAWARTTYFDTDDGAFYRSCNTPVARRLRLREYAAAVDVASAPVLTGERWIELKETRGRERDKVRVAAREGAEPWRGVESIERLLPPGKLSPRVTTWYRRLGLEGDGVRVTLDEGLAYCLPDTAPDVAEPRHVLAYGPSRVLEVKFTGAAPAWLARALEALPVKETTGFSKFLAASLTLRHQTTPRAKHRTEPIVIKCAR